MGHYINLTLTEAQEILSHYPNFSPVEKITPLTLGISNSNYKVTTTRETLLLKVSNDKNIHELQKEQEILHFLQTMGFPYSLAPYPMSNGKFVYHVQSHFGVVFPFITASAPAINKVSCSVIGEALAKLHLLSEQQALPATIRSSTEVGFDARQIRDYVETASTCPADFRQFFQQVFPDHLQNYLNEDFARGLIHGDLYYDNTLFQGDQIAAMLDFEQAGQGEFLLDIGISISGTCLKAQEIDLELLKHFMRGYQNVRPLPPVEKKFLTQAIAMGLFSISLWRIKRFTEGNLDPLKADSYRELLQRAVHFQKTLSLSAPLTF